MTIESNRRIMERFTSEFLTTDDPAEALRLAEQWIDPDITLHFAGTEPHGTHVRWLAGAPAGRPPTLQSRENSHQRPTTGTWPRPAAPARLPRSTPP